MTTKALLDDYPVSEMRWITAAVALCAVVASIALFRPELVGITVQILALGLMAFAWIFTPRASRSFSALIAIALLIGVVARFLLDGNAYLSLASFVAGGISVVALWPHRRTKVKLRPLARDDQADAAHLRHELEKLLQVPGLSDEAIAKAGEYNATLQTAELHGYAGNFDDLYDEITDFIEDPASN